MNRRLFFLTLFTYLTLQVTAQTGYASFILQEMGELLQRRGCQVSSPGTFPLPKGYKHSLYEVRTDGEGNVTHLGIPVMNRVKTEKSILTVYDFVERYLLHLSLLSPDERNRMLKDDKVTITDNGSVLIKPSNSIRLDSDEKSFHLQWKNDNDKEICRMDFPKDIQLILGKNKIEIETDFLQRLNLLPKDKIVLSKELPKDESVTLSSDSTYYIYKGNQYILKEINSDTYFVKDENGRLTPLYDVKYPSETLANLFNSLLTGNYTLSIVQRLYGGKKVDYQVACDKLYSYCQSQGCQPYVGIEAVDANHVEAVVVYENSLYGYNHLLHVDVALDVLREKRGTIDAELYCYIPTYNLKSLFQPSELKKYEK